MITSLTYDKHPTALSSVFTGTLYLKVLVDTRVNQTRNPSRVVLAMNRVARVDLVMFMVFQAQVSESFRNLGDVRRDAPRFLKPEVFVILSRAMKRITTSVERRFRQPVFLESSNDPRLAPICTGLWPPNIVAHFLT
jgi:hypothetical protein